VIEDILAQLEKVKRTGKSNWMACCPAHEDRSPSMTIGEGSEGRVVVRCFAGCTIEEIVNAVGLGWEPWFPPKPISTDFAPPIRRRFPAGDVLEALHAETMVVSVSAANLAQGVELTSADRDRLKVASYRISQAREAALG
jgi:hypothetical protein